MAFKDQLQLIKRGDPVIEGSVNDPLVQLNQNVRYLYDLIKAATIGSTIFARQVTVEPGAVPGMPVYYNPATQRFERAVTSLETDLSSGVLRTSPSTNVWGVIYEKFDTTLADLLLYGYAPLDLTLAVDGPVVAGVYFLSGVTPGKMNVNRPPVAVPVLRSDGNGMVFVTPTLVDFFDRHIHYHFGLYCQPAGDTMPPAPGGRHIITNPDPNLVGWLPANHAVFNGLAPPGAVFGYNIKAHQQLNAAWPPLPAQNSYLEWNRGDNVILSGTPLPFGGGVPLGAGGMAIIDRNGLWWLTDCNGDCPWPATLDTAFPNVSSQSLGECPYTPDMRMDLWFTRINFATDTTAVTSLRSIDPRIKVLCLQTGLPATAGDLELMLDFSFLIQNDTAVGSLAFKELTGNQFRRGRVVEGLLKGSPNVVLSSPVTRPVDPNNPLSATLYQDIVTVAVTPQNTLELDTQLVRLDSVTEEYYQNLMYLGFGATEQTSLRAKIHVPYDLVVPNPMLSLRFRVLGRNIGTTPQMTVTARRVPRPSTPLATLVPLPLLATEFPITINFQTTLVTANLCYEAESLPFAIAPGDIVFFSITRNAPDGYNGEIGLLQLVGAVSGA